MRRARCASEDSPAPATQRMLANYLRAAAPAPRAPPTFLRVRLLYRRSWHGSDLAGGDHGGCVRRPLPAKEKAQLGHPWDKGKLDPESITRVQRSCPLSACSRLSGGASHSPNPMGREKAYDTQPPLRRRPAQGARPSRRAHGRRGPCTRAGRTPGPQRSWPHPQERGLRGGFTGRGPPPGAEARSGRKQLRASGLLLTQFWSRTWC